MTKEQIEQARKDVAELIEDSGLNHIAWPHSLMLKLLDALESEQAELERVKEQVRWRPEIVCLCGSTRFMEAFQAANLKETLAGRIVLSVGCNTKADADIFKLYDYEDMIGLKGMLDELHKRKIDLSDEVLVLNVGGYIGESTRSEIQYAEANRKPVRYLEPLPEPPKGEGK